ncbi:hypothetical protein GCM10007908_30610 [Rhizobium albus]|nr:hypothetical protein GCM10007908_30610 [Rhizobium albus]
MTQSWAPVRFVRQRFTQSLWRQIIVLSGYFDRDWYLLAYPDVLRTGRDPLDHFLRHGHEGRSPGPRFDAAAYLAHYEVKGNPLVHYLMHGRRKGFEVRPPAPSEADRVVASGFFDAKFYLETNPDVRRANYPALLHYMLHGALEGRSPGPDFDAQWYLMRNPDIVGMHPLLHYIDYGRFEGRKPRRPDGALKAAREAIASVEDLDVALYGADYFAHADYLEVVDGAAHNRLERALTALVDQIEHVPERIVFMPWLVRGGAERVAAHAVRAMAERLGPERVLVILADYDLESARDMIAPDIPVLSFSRVDPDLSHDERVRLVELLVRGFRPEAILNVNSRACWDAVLKKGRVLARYTRLYGALFCADFTPDGRRAGYSDLYLRDCLAHLSGVYFDNAAHRAELIQSLGIPESLVSRLVVARQPAPAGRVLPQRKSTGRQRVIWASRLSRQKNIPLLLRIARAVPEFDFEIFGKGDVEHEAMVTEAAREIVNLRYHGAFDDFSALPLTEADVFLYTSHWDGLPNILLEAGACGLPVVAPNVGGISELIDDDTGYLIDDPDALEGFVSALRAIGRDPAEARQRAGRLQKRVADVHSWAGYVRMLEAEPRQGGLLHVDGA